MQQVKDLAEEHSITVADQKPADIGDIQSHLSNPDAWKDEETATQTRKFLYQVKYGYNRDSHWMNKCEKAFEKEHNVIFQRKKSDQSGRGGVNNMVSTFHRLMMKKKNEVAKRLARTEMKATGTQVRMTLARNSRYWVVQRAMPRPLRGKSGVILSRIMTGCSYCLRRRDSNVAPKLGRGPKGESIGGTRMFLEYCTARAIELCRCSTRK